MNELSLIAKSFLAKHERLLTTTNRDDIIETFKINNAPVFESLIEFQQKYSGYEFMAGLEPVYFTLLHGDGGYPRTNTAEIDFYESEGDESKYLFVCAQTEYQMNFTLDEHGRYYEDGEIVASNFGKFIEHLALWDELKSKGNFESFIRDQKLNIKSLPEKLHLENVTEATDKYTSWYKNNLTYMYIQNGLTTIITSDKFENIQKIIEEE